MGSKSGFDLFLKKKSVKETDLYRIFLKNSFDAILLTDADTGIIFDANTAASKLMAKPIDKIIGTHKSELYAKNGKSKIKEISANRGKRCKYVREERAILRPDGTKVPVESNSQLIEFNGKKLLHEVFRDTTEHKKMIYALKESENRYKTIIEYSNDMIWTLDEKGCFNFFNERAEQITGYRLKHWLGKSFAPIIAKEDLGKINDIFQKIMAGKTMQYEARIIHQNGKIIVLFVNTAPIYVKGKIAGTVSFGRDITAQKYAQEELKKYRDHLEELVKERSDELQKTADEVKKANKELKTTNTELESFTFTVSHDIKEPLRAMRTFSEILLKDHQDKLNAEGKDYLGRISRASFRINNLIDDLLSLSRISNIKNPFEMVDCNKLATETIAQIKPLIKEKKVKIQIINKLPRIFCSYVKIKEVFYNLIVNAITYNNKQKPMVEVGIKDNIFFVKDNGLGIKKEYFDDIFSMFRRFHPHIKYKGGTGIGLAIVKKVIDEHHGKIWLESEEKKGTVFFFTIPTKTERDK